MTTTDSIAVKIMLEANMLHPDVDTTQGTHDRHRTKRCSIPMEQIQFVAESPGFAWCQNQNGHRNLCRASHLFLRHQREVIVDVPFTEMVKRLEAYLTGTPEAGS